MFYITIILSLMFYTTKIRCASDTTFRIDYTFNEQADGWFKFHRLPSSWSDAKLRCQAEGAILVSPLTNELLEAILKHISKEPIDAIFIGVHAMFSAGDYTTIEGVPLDRLPVNWSTGEPKDSSKDCLTMKTKDGTTANVKCSDNLPYVCYKKRTDILLTECGTHDKEYKLDARTGSCYKFHTRGLIWSKAYMTCAAEGGHLAIINSDQESSLLQELFALYNNEDITSTNTGVASIGIRDLRDGGSWMTIQGETLKQAGFNRWSGGQPDNHTKINPEGEACGCIYRNGRLNDQWCGLVVAFICEKDPKNLQNA